MVANGASATRSDGANDAPESPISRAPLPASTPTRGKSAATTRHKPRAIGDHRRQARLPADSVDSDPQPPPFIVAGLFPEAEASSLVGPGSFGKSTLKLYESVHVITGRPLYGRMVHKPGAVLCVSKEDRADLIDYRLHRLCRRSRYPLPSGIACANRSFALCSAARTSTCSASAASACRFVPATSHR